MDDINKATPMREDVTQEYADRIRIPGVRLSDITRPDAGDKNVERDPDLDIAIGEDAFRAGWEAAERWYVHGKGPADWASQWAAYTPPEELCGGGDA